MFFSKPVALSILATPASAQDDDRGFYQVAGLGSRKQEVIAAGGNTLDLAIAMLETENMGTDYAYGKLIFASVDATCTDRSRRQQAARWCQLWHLQAELGHAPRLRLRLRRPDRSRVERRRRAQVRGPLPVSSKARR